MPSPPGSTVTSPDWKQPIAPSDDTPKLGVLATAGDWERQFTAELAVGAVEGRGADDGYLAWPRA